MQGTTISTVVSAASSYDLTTLVFVKDELGVTDKANDAVLKRYITWASAAISQACNRVFAVETVKDEFWPRRDAYPYQVPGGVDHWQLSRFPLVSVSSVTEDGTALVDGTDYRTNPTFGHLIRLNGDGYPMAWQPKALVAQFAGGFATTPADLVDAATRMVKNRWNLKGRDPYLMSENIPGVVDRRWWIATGNEAGNVPPDVEDLIDNYRVPVTA